MQRAEKPHRKPHRHVCRNTGSPVGPQRRPRCRPKSRDPLLQGSPHATPSGVGSPRPTSNQRVPAEWMGRRSGDRITWRSGLPLPLDLSPAGFHKAVQRPTGPERKGGLQPTARKKWALRLTPRKKWTPANGHTSSEQVSSADARTRRRSAGDAPQPGPAPRPGAQR